MSKLALPDLDKVDRAALTTFLNVLGGGNRSAYSLNSALIKWNLILKHVHVCSASTRDRYRRSLSKFYKEGVKKGKVENCDAFAQLKSVLDKEIEDLKANKKSKADAISFQKKLNALTTCRLLYKQVFPDDLNLYADMVLLSAVNAGLDYGEIAKLKRGDNRVDLSQSSSIVERNCLKKEQQYVLPLKQWSGSPLFISENVSKVLNAVNSAYSAEDVAVSAWIEAAMLLGYSDAVIKATISRVPDAHAYLNHIEAEQSLSEDSLNDITAKVRKKILEELDWWYLVRLFKPSERPVAKSSKSRRQTPAEISAQNIERRLKESRVGVQTFYPKNEVVEEKKGKRKMVMKPLIPDYMFVKLNPRTALLTENIMSPDGRLTRKGTPYGIIPNSVINHFKAANAIIVSEDDLKEVKEDELELGSIVQFKASSIYGDGLFQVVEIQCNKGGDSTKGQKDVAIILTNLKYGKKIKSTASQVKLYKAAIAKAITKD